MKHIRLFEKFYEDEFPDIFGNSLLRGVKVDKEEYIDDPKLRNVSTGQSMDEDYVSFLNNYKNLGLQNPTKSIHFYLNPTESQTKYLSWYGNPYKPIPNKDAKFSFSRELRNGGLGSTWWFVERTIEEFLDIDNPLWSGYWDFPDMEENKSDFLKEISNYQNLLIKGGVVGNLTYDELLDLSKKGESNLQIWTESSVLHKHII
jgi:hypothetical protein